MEDEDQIDAHLEQVSLYLSFTSHCHSLGAHNVLLPNTSFGFMFVAIKSVETLKKSRVRVVVSRVPVVSMTRQKQDLHPVDPDSRKVLDMKSNKRTAKTVSHVVHLLFVQTSRKIRSKVVSLVLEFAADRIHDNGNDRFHGTEQHLE